MNSRQRVRAAVDFEKPDRIPIDLGATGASTINAVVYDNLKRRCGINTPTKVVDAMTVTAEIEPEFYDRFKIDVVPLLCPRAAWAFMPADNGIRKKLFCGTEVYFSPDTNISEEADGKWLLKNASGQAYAEMPKDGFYFDFINNSQPNSTIDPKAFKPSETVSDEELALVQKRAQHLYENTDKAILGWGATLSIVGLSALLADNITQGMLDEWLIMLMTEKETAHEMMGRYVDAVIKKTELYHQAIGDRCMIWGAGSDDAGTQRAALMPPAVFSEMIKPHYKRLCDWIHTHTHWKTFLHSCGSIYEYIPHWIEAGIDIINPVQISAADMEPSRLMAEFGGKIVFWGGGCDTQNVLHCATPAQVREHVRQLIGVFGSGSGGFVFAQVHNIQQNVPPENVEAMLDAAHEFGKA